MPRMEDRTVDTAGANVFVGAIDADVEVIVMRRFVVDRLFESIEKVGVWRCRIGAVSAIEFAR